MRVKGHFMTVVHWDQAMSCCPSLTILLRSKPLKSYQNLNIHTCYFFTTYLCLWMCAKSKQKIDTNLPLSFPWPPYVEKKNTCMLNDQYIPIFQEHFVSNIQVRFCPILNQHPRVRINIAIIFRYNFIASTIDHNWIYFTLWQGLTFEQHVHLLWVVVFEAQVIAWSSIRLVLNFAYS